MIKNYTKKERSWILYDWANSAYSMTVTSAVLPIFFMNMVTEAGLSKELATSYWGYGNSFASILIAFLSPILGAMADYMGMKKKLFKIFAFMGIFFTMAIAFVPYGAWIPLMIVYILTALGFFLGNVFYDAFITDVTDESRVDKVSTMGFSMGYIGSTIPFIIAMALIILAQKEIIGISTLLATRLSFVITAIWWFTFTLPLLKNVNQIHGIEGERYKVSETFHTLKKSFLKVKNNKRVMWFLLGYFFYIDGVGTIIKMSTSFGMTLGMSATSMLLILLFVQFVAFPFAIIYGKIAEKIGAKKTLYMGVGVYCLIAIYAYFIDSPLDFWILAFLVGTSQGGIQAISRSYFAKLIPKENSNEYFGIYNVFGKFAAILGPFLIGIITQITGNVQIAVSSLIVLFILGVIFLTLESRVSTEN